MNKIEAIILGRSIQVPYSDRIEEKNCAGLTCKQDRYYCGRYNHNLHLSENTMILGKEREGECPLKIEPQTDLTYRRYYAENGVSLKDIEEERRYIGKS